jgi:hypothetical protein
MPTDAKCGLLVGVGVVIAVAVMFFQKEPQNPSVAATTSVNQVATQPTPVPTPAAVATATIPPSLTRPETNPITNPPAVPVSRTSEKEGTEGQQGLE